MRIRKHLVISVLALLASPTTGFAKPYIVLFQQNEIGVGSLSHGQYQNVLQNANAKNVGELGTWLTGGSERAAAASIGDLWLVRGARVDISDAAAAKLAKETWVTGVYPDHKVSLIEPVGTPVLGDKKPEVSETWGLERIGLPAARQKYPQIDGKGVRVGIIDTGIQSRHPEFGAGAVPVVFRDFVNGFRYPYDDHGHGTHVAGTIAGIGTGIAQGATLVVAKALNAVGSGYDSWLLGAMQWVMDPDGDPSTDDFAQLVSNSWGGDIPDGVVNIADFAPYQRALQSWIAGGIVPVFAAGNSGRRPNGIPGGLPDAIAVGAIDAQDAVASFSSRGPNVWRIGNQVLSFFKPDVSAPGVDIKSAFPGNKYATWSGTSMATPHVSGAIALALQANPKLKPAGVKEALLGSVELKMDFGYGYGILNVEKLLGKVLSEGAGGDGGFAPLMSWGCPPSRLIPLR